MNRHFKRFPIACGCLLIWSSPIFAADKVLICIESLTDKTHRITLTGERERFDSPFQKIMETYTDTGIFVRYEFYLDGKPMLDNGDVVGSSYWIDRYSGKFEYKGMENVAAEGFCEEDAKAKF